MLELIKSEWEIVCGCTARMKVIGGWVVRNYAGEGQSMVFVPDEHHRWAIDN